MTTFRYRLEGSKENTIIRPVANIFFLSKSNRWLEYFLYIDSGADVTLIPHSAGLDLGLTLEDKTVQEIGGIRGSVPVVYVKNKIRLGNHELDTEIGWALVEEVPPLLGRRDVFDVFHVNFKQDHQVVEFTPSKTK